MATAVGIARRIAVSFEVTEPALRARWVMISFALMPEFWRDPGVYKMLTAKSGTGNIRFGDFCAFLKVMMRSAGREADIWW